MKPSVTCLREVAFILLFSICIAFIFNYFSDSGITLLRISKEIKWESDSSIANAILSQKSQPIINDSIRPHNSSSLLKNVHLAEGGKNYSSSDNSKRTIDSSFHDLREESTIVKDSISKNKNDNSKTADPVSITLEQAKLLHSSGVALFIDARNESDYKYGHIKGSINIPLKKFKQFEYVLANIEKNKIVVTYCDGRGCDLSIELAQIIKELGFLYVKIFYGGWMDWKENGYPIE